MFNTKVYDVSYATASAVTGPYIKAKGDNAPLLQTGDGTNDGKKLAAPDGSGFGEDGGKVMFLAFKNGEDMDEGRPMFTADATCPGVRLLSTRAQVLFRTESLLHAIKLLWDCFLLSKS